MKASFQSRPTGRRIALVSWQGFLGAITGMPVLFAGTIIAFVLLVWGASYAGQKLDITDPLLDGMTSSSEAWFYVLRELAEVLVLLPLTLAVCRIMLRGETGAGLASSEGRAFSLWALSLAGFCLALLYLRGMMSGAPSLVALVTVFWIIMILTPFCCLLVLPGAVAGESVRGASAQIENSLATWNGNLWLFLRGAFFALGPIALLVYAPDKAIANRGGQAFLDKLYASQTYLLVTAALTPFLVALVAAYVSAFYAAARAPRPAKRVTPPPQTVQAP